MLLKITPSLPHEEDTLFELAPVLVDQGWAVRVLPFNQEKYFLAIDTGTEEFGLEDAYAFAELVWTLNGEYLDFTIACLGWGSWKTDPYLYVHNTLDVPQSNIVLLHSIHSEEEYWATMMKVAMYVEANDNVQVKGMGYDAIRGNVCIGLEYLEQSKASCIGTIPQAI